MDPALHSTAPEVTPEPGWRPIEPPRLEGGAPGGRSFVSGDPRGDRLRVRYFWRGGERPLVGRAWFGRGAEGPPGYAHGGSIAAVLDEAMGAAAWSAGHRVVAVQLDTSFRQLLPLGTDTYLEAWVERVDDRKVFTAGRLLGAAGDAGDAGNARQVFAEARAVFVTLDPERFAAMLAQLGAVTSGQGNGAP